MSEDALQLAEQYVDENPELREALDVLRISQAAYARAYQALLQPSVLVANNANASSDEGLERGR